MICKMAGVCKKTCDIHCPLNVGCNLAKFLREVDTIESKIGDISAGGDISSDSYIISGMEYDRRKSVADLLSSMSTSIDISQKFSSVFNKSATMLLNDYIKAVDPTDGAELRDKLKKIEGNKLLLLPIKPDAMCEVLVPTKNAKQDSAYKNTKVAILKWTSNINTGKLECTIITDVIDTNRKRCKINIEDYGDKIKLTDIERSIASSEINKQMVKMTRFGYIKPVAVVAKDGSGIIIDNTYLYTIEGRNIKLAASWDNGDFSGEELYEGVKKTEVFKKVSKRFKYIWQHRRFIAPYGLSECNIIKI